MARRPKAARAWESQLSPLQDPKTGSLRPRPSQDGVDNAVMSRISVARLGGARFASSRWTKADLAAQPFARHELSDETPYRFLAGARLEPDINLCRLIGSNLSRARHTPPMRRREWRCRWLSRHFAYASPQPRRNFPTFLPQELRPLEAKVIQEAPNGSNA